MISVLRNFTCFFFLIISIGSIAQTVVPVDDATGERMFMDTDQMYLEDPDSNYTIDQVSTSLHDRFITNYLYAPHNIRRESSYWIRIRIKENSTSNKKWMLEFFDQTTDTIEAYIPNRAGSFDKMVFGDKVPFDHRTFRHKNFEIKLPNNTNEIKEYYFRVRADHHVNIIIGLRSTEYFIYYALNEYLLFGFFYGVILVVAIYNLLMYFAIREREYLVYILYILSVGIYTASADGIAFQYLWPTHPEWNNVAYGVFLYSAIVCSMMFTKMFLHTDTNYPVLNKILNGTIIARTIIFLIALLFDHELFEYRWIEFLPLSIAFFSGIYTYRNGFKAARFFALAYGLMVVAFIIKVIINLDLGFIPGTILTHYSVTISFWFEMVLLSFALGDKVSILKDTKDKAMQEIIHQHEINQELKNKVNRELEIEVQKRTTEVVQQKEIIEQQFIEIKQVNEKLVEQAEEISKMNALLDMDNFKLQRSINETMLARVGQKNMTYDEFQKIFPDELSCLRYLERKWENGYTCKKCDNTKSLPGKSRFDKRCSRCGYNESPMAYTLFHGLKFPIEKAFYIVHLVVSDRDDITIDELSSMLDLRRNTCWTFKDKVIKTIRASKLHKHQLDWETIVFKLNLPEQIGG